MYSVLSSTSYKQEPQRLNALWPKGKEGKELYYKTTEPSLPCNALSFCSLCPGALEPSDHFPIYHSLRLQSLPGRDSKELGKSKEIRKQI